MSKRQRMANLMVCALLFSAVTASAQSVSSAYSIIELGFHGAVRAINDNGTVVGDMLIGCSNCGWKHAFVWTQGTGAIDLGTLGGVSSSASAVNNSGMVVGWSETGLGVQPHAFVWTQATGMIDLGSLGGSWSIADAVNENGMVVGRGYLPGNQTTHSFVWTQGGRMLDIGTFGGDSRATAINDDGMVVGWSHAVGGPQRAFAWTETTGMIDLGTLFGGATMATAVNNSGVVAGVDVLVDSEHPLGSPHLFTWTQTTGMIDRGACIDFGYHPYHPNHCRPIAVNASGMMTGIVEFVDEEMGYNSHRTFIWTEATGSVDLGTLGGVSWVSTVTTGLTDSGIVVGTSPVSGSNILHAFAWTPGTGMTDLGTLDGAIGAEVFAVSQDGMIGGYAGIGEPGNATIRAVLWMPATPAATPAGSGVSVQPQAILTDGSTTPVSIGFDAVTSAGETTVTTSPTGLPAPDGFTFGQPSLYYDVATTATFSAATVCFSWTEGQIANENNARLLHAENGTWADVTSSVDPQANVICGRVTSFSPFVIAQIDRYQFSGFAAPLLADGSASIRQSKQGRTIPVKFQLRSLGRPVGLWTATIAVYKVLSAATGSMDMTDLTSDAGNANNSGHAFRFDPSSGDYVYNLSTAGLAAPGTYRIQVTVSDGRVFAVDFSLR